MYPLRQSQNINCNYVSEFKVDIFSFINCCKLQPSNNEWKQFGPEAAECMEYCNGVSVLQFVYS
jgi:hypothetical protein